MDFEACSPVAPDNFLFIELPTEKKSVTTEPCPSEVTNLASELSLTDGERSRDETDSTTNAYPDSEQFPAQAVVEDDLSPDAECSELCPLKDYHPIDEPSNVTRFDPEHELPDQAVQAGKLYKSISDWQSRIIALQPGEQGDPIVVELHVADLINASGIALHDKPLRVQYEALSYCWGTEDATCLIQMNGIDYPVVETLYQALLRLRTDEVRYLWIDALCIDQHNLEERSMQVANMLLLFRKATKVLVWLGEHDGYTRAAWQCLDTFWYPDLGIALSNACPEHHSTISLGIEQILGRPWYRRLWILQEIWAASQVDVILGDDTIKWDTLETFATQFERIVWHKVSSDGTSSLSSYRNDNPFVAGRRAAVREEVRVKPRDQSPRGWLPDIRDSYESRNGSREEELIDVLGGTYTCECKDPRDRVYAVLGMTNAPYAAASKVEWSDDAAIMVDYGKSVSEVYQDVVRYYARVDSSLKILCMDASFGGQVGGEELPSWCPNWSLRFGKDRAYRMGSKIKSQTSQVDSSDDMPPPRSPESDDESDYNERRHWSDLRRSHVDYVDVGGDSQKQTGQHHSWQVLRLKGYVFAVVTGAALWQDFTTYQNSIITVGSDAVTRLDRLRDQEWLVPGRNRSVRRDQKKAPRYNVGPDGVHWYMSGRPPRIDDVIVAAKRVPLLVVLRRQATDSQYKFVGVVETPKCSLFSEIRETERSCRSSYFDII